MDKLRTIIDRIVKIEEQGDVSEAVAAELVDIRLKLNDIRRTLEFAGVLDEL